MCGRALAADHPLPSKVNDEVEVVQIVAVEERKGDLAHLVAGLRLARSQDPLRRSDAPRRIERIRRLGT